MHVGKIQSWIKIASESVKLEFTCNVAKAARGYLCLSWWAKQEEGKRKYTEDINLSRLIETRKTWEALQRWGQSSLKKLRKSNKKVWGAEETERWKGSGKSDGRYEGTWQNDLR